MTSATESMTPRELAEEMAERNGRCGHVSGDGICLLERSHTAPHSYESINRVIPFIKTRPVTGGSTPSRATSE